MTFAVLPTMPAVDLAELTERAALLSRVDRKYLLPLAAAGRLLDTLALSAQVLEIGGIRHFGYESLYFDTPELSSYLRTAYRHRRRFKIRTRTYVDSGECWLEVKVPGPRGSTIKYRSPYEPGRRPGIGDALAFVDEVLARHGLTARHRTGLAPTLRTAYRRCTFLLPSTADRVTVDTDLRWTADGRELRLPGTAIVETKTGAAPSAADRLLWRRGHRPVAISKYATGLAALRAELPAAPWQRLLRQHFTAAREELVR
ncbi:MAG: polyphosphate polymerase domain-containing protein [Actinoplanes sp.]